MSHDELLFLEEDAEINHSEQLLSSGHSPWKILIVDDEEQVHTVTSLVLRDFSFDDRSLELLHAYSADEALKVFKKHADIAICLLDVVMETDSAGLDLVSKIRVDLNNSFTRIVLRTGQPGQAPEESVIKTYDINDYKDKTELTRLKLHTLIYSCLRAYRDIVSLQHTREGLEQVIGASNNVFNSRAGEFAQGILQQFTSLMRFDNNAFYAVEDGLAASSYQGILRIIDGIGEFSRAQGKTLDRILPHEIQDKLKSQEQGFMSMHSDDVYLASAMIDKNRRSILYLQKLGSSTVLQRKLLDIYSNNVLIAFQNIHLMEDIDKAQQEMVYLLAEAIETRSQETGFHLQRVAELSLLLAKGLNLDEDLAMKIHRSSPLHDLGKIAIPDEILNKPGKLTSEEFEKMKAHSQIGHDMIIESERELCQTGRLIVIMY